MKKTSLAIMGFAVIASSGLTPALARGSSSSGYHAPSTRSTGGTSEHVVSGYTRSNGTYVAPHYQTNPNTTRNDNYSTRGNTNPHTSEPGTKPRDGEGTPN